MKNKALIIVLILLCVIVAVSVWFFLQRQSVDQNNIPSIANTTSSIQTTQTTTSALKLYRNEQYGFEFQYPEDWTIEENSFSSPSSKFNLRIFPSNGKYIWLDPIGINLATPDFADRTYSNFDKTPGVTASKIVVGDQVGNKYEYEDEGLIHIDIDLLLGQYRILLGTIEQYENIFNQIISTFKFLK